MKFTCCRGFSVRLAWAEFCVSSPFERYRCEGTKITFDMSMKLRKVRYCWSLVGLSFCCWIMQSMRDKGVEELGQNQRPSKYAVECLDRKGLLLFWLAASAVDHPMWLSYSESHPCFSMTEMALDITLAPSLYIFYMCCLPFEFLPRAILFFLLASHLASHTEISHFTFVCQAALLLE